MLFDARWLFFCVTGNETKRNCLRNDNINCTVSSFSANLININDRDRNRSSDLKCQCPGDCYSQKYRSNMIVLNETWAIGCVANEKKLKRPQWVHRLDYKIDRFQRESRSNYRRRLFSQVHVFSVRNRHCIWLHERFRYVWRVYIRIV